MLFSQAPSFTDHDSAPLATVSQVADWEAKYSEAVIKARFELRTPVGGRLVNYPAAWQGIGASRKVVRWLSKGYKLPFLPGAQEEADKFLTKVCPQSLRIHYSDAARHEALHDLVAKLIDKAVIEPVPEGKLAFHCLLFLRIKPNGTWRGITDTSKLNEFLRVKSFNMDTAKVIREALTDRLWAVSVDFSDAYYHIPVHPRHRKYLAFQVGQTRYWFKATPFGLSPLPQVFTEIFTTLKVYTRVQMDVMTFQYIDDWLLLSRDRNKLAEVSLRFVNLCTDLGIVVNFEKSELVPTQRLVHLGIDWNFATCEVRPPREAVIKLQHHLRVIIHAKKAQLTLLESIRGKLCSMEKVVPFGRINFRYFQALVTRHLKNGRSPRWIDLSDEAIIDLRWWAEPDNLLVGAPFVSPTPAVTVSSDASMQGWGACFDGKKLAGRWPKSYKDQKISINWLEMEAVRLTILHNCRIWRGLPVRFLIDNTTTVAYINKQGGTKSDNMTSLTRNLLLMTMRHKITLTAHHLKGVNNVLSDMLSRDGQVLKNEWKIDMDTFNWVQQKSIFGRATVDLFANQFNHQLPRYGSPLPDDRAVLVDALSAQWPCDEVLYAFPPTTILERTVARIREMKPPRLLFIAPKTPIATWYPALRRVTTQCVDLPPSLILEQPHFDHRHPDPSSARLALWMVQGDVW